MPVEILCIGHAAFDLSVFVESFPHENSKCETPELQESGGGPAANAAYLLSAWGVRCGFAGLIGSDRYGERIREEFQSVGTDISLMELRPGHATPVSIILINKQNGSRTIVNRKMAGSPLQFEEAALKVLSPQVLLFDGHELQASLAALRVFPEAISILDAGSWREGTASLAGQVDYLAASERFALQATGLSNLSDAAAQRACASRLRELYPAIVIITLGENGLIADDGGGFFHLAAYPAPVVDTTAAGDIFHGAFAYAVAQSWSFLESLRFASLTASLSVRVAGGRSSIPSLEKVKEEFAHAG
jgi:sugar/nucleoside kinase (ribokinase family)